MYIFLAITCFLLSICLFTFALLFPLMEWDKLKAWKHVLIAIVSVLLGVTAFVYFLLFQGAGGKTEEIQRTDFLVNSSGQSYAYKNKGDSYELYFYNQVNGEIRSNVYKDEKYSIIIDETAVSPYVERTYRCDGFLSKLPLWEGAKDRTRESVCEKHFAIHINSEQYNKGKKVEGDDTKNPLGIEVEEQLPPIAVSRGGENR